MSVSYKSKLSADVHKIAFSSGESNTSQDADCIETTLNVPSNTELDKVRAVANHALRTLGDIEYPLMLMNVSKITEQFKRWSDNLPNVEPYYAVKCNSDPVLVSYLQSLGVHFDCATSAEMDLVVNQLGHPVDHVIYSNPCKLASHLRYAADMGVRLTIIDNMDEITKIKTEHPTAQVLIRLACVDSSAQCPMSDKFGATNDMVGPLLEYAAACGVDVVGVHFHVGSGCSDPQSYRRALVDARRAFDIGTECGHNMHVLDLGGGFPMLKPDGSCTAGRAQFEDMAAVIRSLLSQLFPSDGSVRFMAEPGRFFAGGTSALVTKIHSKSIVDTSSDSDLKLIRYYINDGLYGSFNCVLFDHQHVRPETLAAEGELGRRSRAKATVFGPTCDGFDKVVEEVEHLPEMHVGERLVWLSMGAYTTAASTTFNGFPNAKYFYYSTAVSK